MRRGFTIIELLVVAAIVGVLAALLLPAVQAARESASRMRCASNLKQLALAVHQYADQHGCLPASGLYRWDSTLWYTSVQVQLLPFLEEAQLFDAFNADCGVAENLNGPSTHAANLTLIVAQVGSYICPSDGRIYPWSATNYHGNLGGPRQLGAFTGLVIPNFGGEGARALRWRDALDGAAHTALFSECLIGTPLNRTVVTGSPPDSERRYYFDSGLDDFSLGPAAVAALLDRCRTLPPGQLGLGNRGVSWHASSWYYAGYAVYNHVGPPNSRSCANDKVWASWALDIWGTAPPSSRHPGGVNVAAGDGGVRFVTDAVDLGVWQAFGTRAGGETGGTP